MAYEVYLGGCALYGVSSVEETAARGVTEHDGIGSGAFVIAQNPSLKNWSIRLELTQQDQGQAGWRAADEVLDELRGQLKRNRGERLVVVSNRQRFSKSALLRDLKYETNYQGVYSVTLSLIEYVGPRVKTAAMPSVARPGTPPKAPDTFKAKDAYAETRSRQVFEVPDSSTIYRPVDPPTGKPVNLAGLQNDAIVRVIKEDANSAFATEQQKEHAAITGVMNDAYQKYELLLGAE